MVLIVGHGTVYATDLSGGIKGLKVGMPKAKVLSMLDSMAKVPSGSLAGSCKSDAEGERCSSWGWGLTYGKIPYKLLAGIPDGLRIHNYFPLFNHFGENLRDGCKHHRHWEPSVSSFLCLQLRSPDLSLFAKVQWLDEPALEHPAPSPAGYLNHTQQPLLAPYAQASALAPRNLLPHERPSLSMSGAFGTEYSLSS